MSNKTELERLNREAVDISRRSASQAQESTVVARQTVTVMESQTEQLTRLNLETEDTHQVLKQNKKIMKDMNRCWVARLFCFGKKRAPSPTKWHGDKVRVDALLKAKTKDKWLSTTAPNSPPILTQTPEVSEQKGYIKSPEISDVDGAVNAELARLESAVDELRDLAAEISVQSAVQQRLTEDLAEGVEKTRQGVRDNEKFFTKIAPKMKNKNKDQYMDTTDKILIKSATASLKHKVSGL